MYEKMGNSCNNNGECNIFSVGIFNNCGIIEIPITAKETGLYTLSYTYKGVGRVYKFSALKGQNLSFKNIFNEGFSGYFEIYTPKNVIFVFNYYDCIAASWKKFAKFRIKIMQIVDHADLCNPCDAELDCLIPNCQE